MFLLYDHNPVYDHQWKELCVVGLTKKLYILQCDSNPRSSFVFSDPHLGIDHKPPPPPPNLLTMGLDTGIEVQALWIDQRIKSSQFNFCVKSIQKYVMRKNTLLSPEFSGLRY